VFVLIAAVRAVSLYLEAGAALPTPGPLGLARPAVRPSHGSRYLTGLVVSSIMLPGLAAAFTVTLLLIHHKFRLNSTPPRCFLVGTALGILAWLGAGWACRQFGDASTADDSAYKDLVNRTLTAATRAHANRNEHATTALSYAGDTLGLFPGTAPGRGLTWASGTGYRATGRLVHGAEEALIPTMTDAEAVCEGLNARLCLKGSRIPGANERIADLELAIRALGGGPLLPAPATEAARCEVEAAAKALPKELAKVLVRDTRQSINEYREGLRNQLVAARTGLFGSVFFAGTMAYLLLGLALLAGIESTDAPDRRPIVAAVAFYMVGAVVGLFKRLHVGGHGGGRDDDAYITTIRLIETPLFSGLAAVGGVVASSLLAAQTQTNGKLTSLDDIFHVTTTSIVAAAVFGLTPNLLVSVLADRAKTARADLASSHAGNTDEAAGTTGDTTTAAGTTGASAGTNPARRRD
jgi:hypothetical protein